jgi:hypothetical protein
MDAGGRSSSTSDATPDYPTERENIQQHMNQRDYAGVISLVGAYLPTCADQNTSYYFAVQQIHANIGLGNLTQAQQLLSQLKLTASASNLDELNLIGQTIALEQAIRTSIGNSESKAANTKLADKSNRPNGFRLEQNYPNPFNPTTRITYAIPEQSHVSLRVYNELGQLVATLVDESQSPGERTVEFNGARLASGIYFYALSAGNNVDVKKLILLK